MKEFLRDWAPPALLKVARALRPSSTGLKGHYTSWAEASAHSAGYDSKVILETVDRFTSAALADGKVCQDGMIIGDASFPFPLVACLLRAPS